MTMTGIVRNILRSFLPPRVKDRMDESTMNQEIFPMAFTDAPGDGNKKKSGDFVEHCRKTKQQKALADKLRVAPTRAHKFCISEDWNVCECGGRCNALGLQNFSRCRKLHFGGGRINVPLLSECLLLRFLLSIGSLPRWDRRKLIFGKANAVPKLIGHAFGSLGVWLAKKLVFVFLL